MDGHEVCFAPVLAMPETADHPHNAARGTFAELGGVKQPAPGPRFSRTPGKLQRVASPAGGDTDEVLAEWGVAKEQVSALREQDIVV